MPDRLDKLGRHGVDLHAVSVTVGCQYSAWTSYANDSTCTPLAKSAASPYTVTTARQCQVKYGSWRRGQLHGGRFRRDTDAVPVSRLQRLVECRFLHASGAIRDRPELHWSGTKLSDHLDDSGQHGHLHAQRHHELYDHVDTVPMCPRAQPCPAQ